MTGLLLGLAAPGIPCSVRAQQKSAPVTGEWKDATNSAPLTGVRTMAASLISTLEAKTFSSACVEVMA
ncbi:hypothetical protein M2336_001241 [Sphingobium sp. B1D7B]|nr:hypothetical protein [Sphingobium sp. B1D7B]